MSNGVGAVGPENMGAMYDPHSGGVGCLLPCRISQQPLLGQERGAILPERLLSAANEILRKEGIRLPSATLEVTRNQEVVMHGVPNSGPILVCAQTEAGIKNYL